MKSLQTVARRSSGPFQWALLAAFSASVLVASTASAQQTNNTNNANNAAGGQQAGLLNSDVGLSVDEAFQGGIQRGDSVGQSQTVVGGAADSTAGGGAGGGRAGGGGFGGLGGFGGGLGAAFGNLFGGGRNAGTSSTPPLRTRLKSAVSVAPKAPGTVRLQAAQTLERAGQSRLNPAATAGQNGFRGVSVQMQARTAILTGTVTTERERRMAELMMRLEPGVSRVDNRLQTDSSR
ncbi:MAG: BON domain-containing protein [Planctomycetota bacterium]